jgi:hypothetical protein
MNIEKIQSLPMVEISREDVFKQVERDDWIDAIKYRDIIGSFRNEEKIERGCTSEARYITPIK